MLFGYILKYSLFIIVLVLFRLFIPVNIWSKSTLGILITKLDNIKSNINSIINIIVISFLFSVLFFIYLYNLDNNKI